MCTVTTLPELGEILSREENQSRGVILKFGSTTCPPCQAAAPVFKRLAQEYQDVLVIDVDVKKSRDIVTNFNVKKIPTFIAIHLQDVVDVLPSNNVAPPLPKPVVPVSYESMRQLFETLRARTC